MANDTLPDSLLEHQTRLGDAVVWLRIDSFGSTATAVADARRMFDDLAEVAQAVFPILFRFAHVNVPHLVHAKRGNRKPFGCTSELILAQELTIGLHICFDLCVGHRLAAENAVTNPERLLDPVQVKIW